MIHLWMSLMQFYKLLFTSRNNISMSSINVKPPSNS